MPCGHVFCGSCIDQSISHASNTCPTCRKLHGVDSASDLPVNFYILKQVDDPPKKVAKLDKDYNEELHGGNCSKHRSSNLYFICRTHNIQVCRECTVITHQPGLCDIISFQENFEESKSNLIVEVNTKINSVKETHTELQYYAKKEEGDLKKKRDQVERLLQEIENETEKHDEVKKKITELEVIKVSMESLKTELASSKNQAEITMSSNNLKDKWRNVKLLEDSIDLNSLFSNLPLTESLLSETPKRFLDFFRKKPDTVHAIHHSGQILLSAELSLNERKIHLNALCKSNNQLPQTGIIVQASQLLKLVIPQFNISYSESKSFPLEFNQARPIVFLTFASSGNILGTVYISVNPNAPYAKQFLDLFIGSKGSSYKGMNGLELINNKKSKHTTYGIACRYHIQKSESKERTDAFASSKVSSSTTLYYTGVDETRSEAKLQFRIHNFSNLKLQKGPIFSEPCYVQKLPWKIMVEPRTSQNKEKQPQQSLGFFLKCIGESDKTNWSCKARGELKLLAINEDQKPFTRKIEHLFNSKEHDWGFANFIAWNDVLNLDKGYIEDDTITLEVCLSADKPEGIPLAIENQVATCQDETSLYMFVQVVLEDSFKGHQGNDLYDINEVNYQYFRVKKTTSLQEFLQQVASTLHYSVEQIRPWPLMERTNGTTRPTVIDLETEIHKTLTDLSENKNYWPLFMEILSTESGLRALPAFDKDLDVLLFFKYYNPRNKCLRYCGHQYINIDSNVKELVSLLNERAGLPQGTELALFEEIKPNLLERLTDLDRPLQKVLDELMDGDIIVFQCADLLDDPSFELPSCRDYFRKLAKSINKKGEVCLYGKSGFAILHDCPPSGYKENIPVHGYENNPVLGYVTSGLEIISNIAENISKIQPKPRSPISNVTIAEVGIVIKS